MRVSRALVVILVLMVSPVAGAVCEVVCGIAPHSAHQAAAAPEAIVDEHAHHGHHAPAAPEAIRVSVEVSDGVTISIPVPECDLRSVAPARVRTTFDGVASSAAVASATYQIDNIAGRDVFQAVAASSPPAPPPLITLSLRI